MADVIHPSTTLPCCRLPAAWFVRLAGRRGVFIHPPDALAEAAAAAAAASISSIP